MKTTDTALDMKYNLELRPLMTDENEDFVTRNQDTFIRVVEEEFGHQEEEPISKDDIRSCLNHPLEKAFNVLLDGDVIGGVAVRIDKETNINCLDLIFVDWDKQGNGIGFAVWKLIEEKYPETQIWETHTPYFDLRNIHFYINKCGFAIVEFLNEYHKGNEEDGPGGVPFFRFEKKM